MCDQDYNTHDYSTMPKNNTSPQNVDGTIANNHNNPEPGITTKLDQHATHGLDIPLSNTDNNESRLVDDNIVFHTPTSSLRLSKISKSEIDSNKIQMKAKNILFGMDDDNDISGHDMGG